MTVIDCNKCFERGHTREDCQWSSDELHSIGKIAAFIGARLNYVLPECNGGRQQRGRSISTIKVAQHKEKFWWVRIYCTLADDGLVQARWLEDRQHENDGEGAPKEYKDKRFRLDVWHYRTCHLDMIKLLPHKMKNRIRSQADYVELLWDDVTEMVCWVDRMAAADGNPAADYLKNYRLRYSATTNEELKDRLAALYEEPSIRDWIGDA